MIKRLLPLIVCAAIFLPMIFIHSCANTTQAPTGGVKDTIPPLIIDINPLPGAVNVPTEGSRIIFKFDEYVTIKEQKNIFLSPPPEKPLKVRIKDKFLIVSFESPLDSNTTYIEEVGEFAARADKALQEAFTYCCELKFDGTAICLTYRNGRLLRALTRGDGAKGDDVTRNVVNSPSSST